MRIKRLFATVLAAACLSFSLVGCGEQQGVGYLDANGNIPSWGLSEAGDGYYILKAADHRVYQGFKAGYIDDKHFWLTEKMDNAIPVLTVDDQIIVKNIASRPSSYRFIRFIDYGYTVGTNFSIIQESNDIKSPTIITFGQDRNPASPVGSYIDQQIKNPKDGNVKILKINDNDFKASMLTEAGYLKGLTKNGMYSFSYYEGTYYKKIQLKADSHLFLADTTYNSTSYSEMQEKDNYFIINLPASLSSGYYYLENYGLFRYEGNDSGIGTEIKKEIDDEESTLPYEDEDETPETTYDIGGDGETSEEDIPFEEPSEETPEEPNDVGDDTSGEEPTE